MSYGDKVLDAFNEAKKRNPPAEEVINAHLNIAAYAASVATVPPYGHMGVEQVRLDLHQRIDQMLDDQRALLLAHVTGQEN